MEKTIPAQKCQAGKSVKQAKSGVKGTGETIVVMLKLKGVSVKGKKKWVGKAKKKFSGGFTQNGNLNLEKRQRFDMGGTISSEDSSFSCEESMSNRIFKDSLKVRRECSKTQANTLQNVRGSDGPRLLTGSSLSGELSKPKKISFINLYNSPDGSQNKDNRLELYVDLGLVEESSSKVLSQNILKPILGEGKALQAVAEETIASSEDGISSDNSSLKEAMVKTTIVVEEERFREDDLVQISEATEKEIEISSRSGQRDSVIGEELVRDAVAVEDTETRCPNPATKKKGKFNKGSFIKHSMKIRNSRSIEEEVSKVMEVGKMLGFNFTGIEQEMSEVIAIREDEDLARVEDQIGMCSN